MTDNDIIKALECCIVNSNCNGCPFYQYGKITSVKCLETTCENALDLIKRQRAEKDGLQKLVNLSIDTQNDLTDKLLQAEENLKTVKTEAITEFAERLKDERDRIFNTVYSNYHFGKEIDQIAKEMKEGVNNEG